TCCTASQWRSRPAFQPQEPPLQITRREFCLTTSAVALATAVLGVSSLSPLTVEAWADSVPTGELMQPEALPEMAMGDEKAPVTIIEYASMTCPHCAHFQETTFPEIKKRYIDTGKVRWIFREFPLDNLAAAAFMLARCAGKDDSGKYFALIDTLFRQQRQWAVEKPIPPLLAIAKQAGLTEQSFNACLANQQVLDGIESMRKRAVDKFKVQSTPTFFINGTQYPGALSIDERATLIDPYHRGGQGFLDRGRTHAIRKSTAFLRHPSRKVMKNRLDIPRGSCPCERGDSFSGPMWRTPSDSGQATERPSDLFSTKPTKRMCAAPRMSQKMTSGTLRAANKDPRGLNV